MSKNFIKVLFLIEQGQIFNIIYITFTFSANLFLNNFVKPKKFNLTGLQMVKEKHTPLLLLK